MITEARLQEMEVAPREALGFDRPPRRYGMAPLWGNERAAAQKG